MKMFEQPMKVLAERGVTVLDINAAIVMSEAPADDRHAVVVLCTAGEAWMEFNMEIMHVTPRTRVCLGRVMMSHYSRVSPDFEATVVVLDPDLALEATVGLSTETLRRLFASPVQAIADERDWALLCSQVECLRRYRDLPPMSVGRELPVAMARSLLLTLCGAAMREAEESTSSTFSMADNYFRRFIEDVSDHLATEHEVAFYAERLCITPKYLSDICKRKGGHTAKEVISQLLAARIKREIMLSGKSMKTIAAEYGFADQSSLGKFFRKATGKTPASFKSQIAE